MSSEISEPQTDEHELVPEPAPETEALVEELEEIEQLETDAPRVGIIAETKADLDRLLAAERHLNDRGISCEVRVMSAEREPETVREYCANAKMRGMVALIAGAPMSAALPAAAASHSELPVVGVPLLGEGEDGPGALLAAVQVPPGVPVACVAVDGAESAGAVAARIVEAAG